MQVRFLLGPAGSGKTFRCLTEIRKALLAEADGGRLILLAPKQATFQLERQLLAHPSLHGYTRLHILSFERLAGFVFRNLKQPLPEVLADEGRVMVLRALLAQKKDELRLFRASSRLPGFADQLAQVLRELHQYHLTPSKLEALASKVQKKNKLDAKLHDLALILRAYLDWLKARHLEDGDRLLDLAAALLTEETVGWTTRGRFVVPPLGGPNRLKPGLQTPTCRSSNGLVNKSQISNLKSQIPIAIQGLWLDGFAQMTPQEMDLLLALVPHCQQTTLAFCLEAAPPERDSWLSMWSLIGETCFRLQERMAALPARDVMVEVLRRNDANGRFAENPVLRHLERCWAKPEAFGGGSTVLSRSSQVGHRLLPPHPGPLPRGEGGAPAAALRTDKSGMIEEPAAVFPLPAGEGQGEGERDVQPPSSSVRPANPTTVDQLRGRLEACPMLEEVLRVVGCWNPEAEATFAAREILRFVRDQRGRFRDCAVLLRSFAGYEDAVPRVFHRYQIPFFLDRRELVAHHPLAELTRFALRTVAFQWEHDDWFGALKTGLAEPDDAAIDRLENEALGRGWRGPVWFQPIRVAGDPALTEWIERIRRKIVPPFEELAKRLKLDRSTPPRGPTGAELAGALRELWNRLGVGKKLEDWTRKGSDPSPFAPRLSPIHQTVWTQMHDFLRDLELAFRDEPLPLTDWLPVVEAGLSRLTVGVVPPALDQVLVGVIDRSRNPDLQFAAVLGMNEGIFPAPPAPPVLLSQSDRDTLAALGAALGPDRRQQIGIERFYGYIACTRARRTLLLTFARRDAQGRDLNPSPFLDHLHSLFPGLASERFEGASDWRTAEHPSELIVPLLKLESGLKRRFADVGQASSLPPSGEFVTDSEAGKMSALPLEHALLEAVPQLKPVLERRRQVREAFALSRLSADLAERIYGRNILTSVSALEDFAACPFKFFAARGLRAEERIEFEVDHREKGSFQHEVLREFHRRVQADGKRWREVSPAEARRLARQIGEELLPAFREGLFLANQARRFAGRLLIEGLEQLMETLARWAVQYQFDPQAVEVSFGLKESVLPAWRIALDGTHALLLRGRIDRVDLCRIEGSAEALAVVIDYKSSARELDPVLVDHGLELQLLAYAGALSELEGLETELQAERLLPAGVFYVGLKGSGSSARTRRQERQEREIARHAGYQHRGRFDRGQLARFDNRGQPKGDQFKYAKNRDGSFSRRGNEALPTDEFQVLVAKVKALLRRHGCGIYSGQVEVAPYRWKQETACDFCAYRPVCRFDPWSQPYRVLRPPPKGQRA